MTYVFRANDTYHSLFEDLSKKLTDEGYVQKAGTHSSYVNSTDIRWTGEIILSKADFDAAEKLISSLPDITYRRKGKKMIVTRKAGTVHKFDPSEANTSELQGMLFGKIKSKRLEQIGRIDKIIIRK